MLEDTPTKDNCDKCEESRDKGRLFCQKCEYILWENPTLTYKIGGNIQTGNSHQGWH